MQSSDSDTIVAIATPPGAGGIGIVRISGTRAVEIAGACFSGRCALQDAPPRTLIYGRFVDKGQDLDEVLASVMYGPASFTGEDTVEFNCHGGPLLLRRACRALRAAGARAAEPGEFSKRAFLNGRIDLTQAEAIADMIAARTDTGLESAFFQLRGALRDRFARLGHHLRACKATIEADLDFSEDVTIDRHEIVEGLEEVREAVAEQIAGYRTGRLLRDGARIAICGRPNVGKSSLMNRLLGEDRAIVTDQPGTTRDTLEEAVDLDGLLAHLVDTAGMRETHDPVEREGTRRSHAALQSADFVLLVVAGSEAPFEDDRRIACTLDEEKSVLLLNKRDLGVSAAWASFRPELAHLEISAKTGAGIPDMRRQLRERILGTGPGGVDHITHERHRDGLERAEASLARAARCLSTGEPLELAAFEVGEALEALGDIIGETTPQDVLDTIFSSFCIGK